MPLPPADSRASNSPLPARRRSELVRLVCSRGQVTVAEIASLFDVSADTIRRDLDALAEQRLLKRTHGGAVAEDSLVGTDAPFLLRKNAQKDAKSRIARAFAAELGGRSGLTVVTNNLSLPAALPSRAIRDIYVLGGQVRFEAQVTLGTVGFAGTGSISADTAVIGVTGISPAGISASALAEAEMTAAMLAACRRVIVLADATKFGRNAFAHIAALDRVHVLVTDAEPPMELRLDEAGVEVVRADPVGR
jgi:DeoR/GlpR family transcriptional regulator of sugar metabolism